MHPAEMVNMKTYTANVNVFEFILYIAVSYVLGFTLSVLGNEYLRLYELIVKGFKGKSTFSSNGTKASIYVYAREWNRLNNFCSTVSITILALSILFLVKFESFTFITFLFFFLLSLLLVKKAAIYHQWVHKDLDAVSAYMKKEDRILNAPNHGTQMESHE